MFAPVLWNSSPGAASTFACEPLIRYGAFPVRTTLKNSAE